jgi:hypothetical protein
MMLLLPSGQPPTPAAPEAALTPAELLEVLTSELSRIAKLASVAGHVVGRDEFLTLTDLPEDLEELQAHLLHYQDRMSEQLEALRADCVEPEEEEEEEPEEGGTVPLASGTGEPPPHDDEHAPPPGEEEVPRG